MAIFVFTGKLGSGKTLCAVGRIKDYLEQDKKIATNIDLNLHNLIGYQSKKCQVFRIPDRPIIEDLEAIGLGYDGDYRGEEENGLIVLDECAQFLNTRNFQDKERKKIVEWFVHARKKRWDVVFIIQHLNALDKQFRDMFAEHIVYCNRLDRLKMPFGIRHLSQAMGFSGNLPKIHRALVMYGQGPNAMKVDSWIYTGKSLYDAFYTEQGFNAEHDGGIYQLVPPWYTHGRFYNDWHYFKTKAKTVFNSIRLKMRHFFLSGLLAGVVGTSVAVNDTFDAKAPGATQPTVSPDQKTQPTIETEELNIYITGSIIGTHTDIYFERDGVPFEPRNLGYKYLVRGPCHVILMKDGNKKDVYCGAARRREPATATQGTSNVDLSTQEAASSRINQGKQNPEPGAMASAVGAIIGTD